METLLEISLYVILIGITVFACRLAVTDGKDWEARRAAIRRLRD